MNSSPVSCCSLASQTHFRKRGKGLVNCVYKSCPTALYSQSNHVALFCHMTHYINVWVAIAILKCQKRARTYFRYCRNCKKHFSGSLLSLQQVIQERIFQIWLHHPANCILVGHGLYTQFTMQTLPFLSLVWLARLHFDMCTVLLEGFLIIQLLIVLMYTITVWKPQTLRRVNNYTQLEVTCKPSCNKVWKRFSHWLDVL